MKEGGVSHDDPDPQIISVKCEKKPKSTKKVIFHTSDIGGRERLGCPAQHHKQGVHSNIRAITEYLRKYMAAPKEVQIITLRCTMQPI